jgi:hypothetical protein
MRWRLVLASILGNGLEWFDFASYGYFASGGGRYASLRAAMVAQPPPRTQPAFGISRLQIPPGAAW